MAPRTRPKRGSNVASATAESQAATAAATCYAIAEIRQSILRCLSRGDLARFITVEKKGMYGVAKELYHTISYKLSQGSLSKSAARRKLYCESVVEINARASLLPPSIKRQLPPQESDPNLDHHADDSSWDSDYDSESESEFESDYHNHVKRYSPETYRLIVPGLQKKFPQLRCVRFGSRRIVSRSDSWTVHLARKGHGDQTGVSPQGGHIDVARKFRYTITKPPPTTLTAPIPPSSGFTMQQRVNLDLMFNAYPAPSHPFQDWLAALHKPPFAANLYTSLDVAQLPITLASICELYRHQIAAGHTTRLADIHATHVIPWDIGDFRDFSTLASASITSLVLACQYPPLLPDNDSSCLLTIYPSSSPLSAALCLTSIVLRSP